MIVCWENDWLGCPLEVVELKEIIKSLPNEPISRPDVTSETGKYTIEDHLSNFPGKVGILFRKFDEKVKEISEEIWSKVGAQPGVTYYSPERVFVYLNIQKQGLRLTVFTRGEKLESVKQFKFRKGGAKWGITYLRDEKNLEKILPVIEECYERIKEAVKDNEPTGWYAELEEEEE